MKFTLLLLILISNSAYSTKLKVMTFNTMCDFCKGSSFFDYDKRVDEIQKSIRTLEPDIISLQEVRTVSQLKNILKPFEHYNLVTSDYGLVSYADPAIIYDKTKYKLIEKGQFWLGPNKGKFSFGWKFALPRQVHWVKLEDLETKQNFYFISSHFDNRIENLEGSVEMLRDFLKDKTLPTIFAADTNLTTDMLSYKKLVNNLLVNAFDLRSQFTAIGTYKSEKDLCYLRKGKKFPECRVDHILLSKNTSWKVYSFIVDANKSKEMNFSSDHRPVMAIVEF
jgi:endonuclease/exonuclease/phosphatase family metal-dependent hydrolase